MALIFKQLGIVPFLLDLTFRPFPDPPLPGYGEMICVGIAMLFWDSFVFIMICTYATVKCFEVKNSVVNSEERW